MCNLFKKNSKKIQLKDQENGKNYKKIFLKNLKKESRAEKKNKEHMECKTKSKMRNLNRIISGYIVNVNGLILPFKNGKSNGFNKTKNT